MATIKKKADEVVVAGGQLHLEQSQIIPNPYDVIEVENEDGSVDIYRNTAGEGAGSKTPQAIYSGTRPAPEKEEEPEKKSSGGGGSSGGGSSGPSRPPLGDLLGALLFLKALRPPDINSRPVEQARDDAAAEQQGLGGRPATIHTSTQGVTGEPTIAAPALGNGQSDTDVVDGNTQKTVDQTMTTIAQGKSGADAVAAATNNQQSVNNPRDLQLLLGTLLNRRGPLAGGGSFLGGLFQALGR